MQRWGNKWGPRRSPWVEVLVLSLTSSGILHLATLSPGLSLPMWVRGEQAALGSILGGVAQAGTTVHTVTGVGTARLGQGQLPPSSSGLQDEDPRREVTSESR